MKKRMARLSVVGALLIGLSWLSASDVRLNSESQLWLVGDSTLHAFTSRASEINFDMVLADKSQSAFEQIKGGNMTALTVRVPVNGLKSGKDKLDKNLWKALKAETSPAIEFRMATYTVSSSSISNQFNITAMGDLTIAGETKPVDLQAVVTDEQGARIRGKEELLMTTYGVKPPTVMGAIRTHDRVVVNFDLLLDKNPK